jgi:hypothetical protein
LLAIRLELSTKVETSEITSAGIILGAPTKVGLATAGRAQRERNERESYVSEITYNVHYKAKSNR